MSIIYFIQDNALLLGVGVVVVVLCITVLSSLFSKKESAEPVLVTEVSEPVQGTTTYVTKEDLQEAEVITVEEVREQVEAEVVKKAISPFTEAREWWKSLPLSDKKLYAFDAQLGDRKLSTFKSSDILLIYNTFTENNQITTK